MTTQHDEIPDDQLTQTARIRRLFSSMPYGGGLGFRYPDSADEWTLDDIEHNIRLLRDCLAGVAKRDQDNESRLMEHEALFAALGRLAQHIGIAPSAEAPAQTSNRTDVDYVTRAGV